VNDVFTNSLILSTAVALGVGLLIGIERERSKGSGPSREFAGVRTFAIALLLAPSAPQESGALGFEESDHFFELFDNVGEQSTTPPEQDGPPHPRG
jgi:hypothetical protein